MNPSPRIRISGPVRTRSWTRETGATERIEDRLLIRDLVRIVFFVPCDHFQISAGVSHALDSYLRAVEGHPEALSRYTCCYWEPRDLSERGWELIRESLRPKERRYFDDYTPDEAFHPEKEGADPYFSIYADDDRGYAFSYHARLAWREPPPHSVSVLQVTLPTEYLEERGADAVRALALDMGSRLPFASGHAGLALSCWYPVDEQLDRLRPVIFRHPGFDIRNASIHDNMGTRVDGIHWLNFLGQPVLNALGGASVLQARLQCPTTTVQEMEEQRVVVSTGSCPEAGDLDRGQDLPAYRELARVLEPWMEPFPWRLTHFTDPSVEEELRRWWRRFLDW
ncbi:MAG TPA: type VI immunity family protein [Archangium sp.]|uniref:type VI immunity family protein n=1 Tax=Archangium sp. TaxID=1872627 RepID=UPI002E3589C2|nr:type VI immunity family protein [Archangium sp.]HEX5751454.1 type VI immunity family protein [Archangium sp.]